MTEPNQIDDRPDIESIMSEIRENIQEVPEPEQPQERKSDDVLSLNLEAVNRSYVLGEGTSEGISGLRDKSARILLGPLIGEINNFHGCVVRALNAIAELLGRIDTSLSGELLDENRRRIKLLSHLSERLADYDNLQIDQRLRQIEDKLKSLEERNGS